MSSSGGSISSYIGSKWATIAAVIAVATGAALVPVVTGGTDPCAGFSFCDEFDGSSVDTSKWIALNSHADTTNSEPGCYTSANVTVSGGLLTETAENRAFTCPDTTGSNSYPTGAIQFKTYSFRYGTLDVRAKVAGCTGCWPAIWMLGTNCQSPAYLVNGLNPGSCVWPQSGSQEIDIAEFLSSNFTKPWSNIITSGGSQPNQASNAITNASSNFHTYTIVWSAGSLVVKIDGATITTYSSNVPSTPMFLIVNTTLGAQGGTISNGTLPATTQIDYVHVTEG